MYTINLVLYSYFAVILSILLFYCIGEIILKYVLKISLPVSAQRIFTSSFTGIFISVLCYSLIQTLGNTSSLLFIPLIGFYFFFVKRKNKQLVQSVQPTNVTYGTKLSVYTFFGYNILISLLLYLLFCYANLDSLYHFRPADGDDYSYGMLAQYLNRGFENLAFSKNFWVDSLHYPYHYFEIWLNALLYKVFHLNSTWTYSMILPTILHTIIFWGLMSIVERYKKINLLTVGICFILLFTTEISIILSRFENSPFPYPNQYCSGLILTKVAPVCLFFLAVTLLLINKRNKEALLVALSMPIVSFIMTPIVFAITGYLILKDLINNKGAVKYEYLILYIVMLCLFAGYILLGERGGQNLIYNKFPSVNEMKWRLFITNPISFGMRYMFPIVFILLIDFKRFLKFCKRYVIEIFLFFTISTAFNVVLRPVMADATQFTSFAYYGIFNILFPSLILYYWKNDRMRYLKKIALLFVFITGYLLNITTVISFFSNNRYLSNTNRLKYEETVMKNIQTGKIHVGIIRSDTATGVWGSFINSANQNYVADHNYIVSFLEAYKNDVIYYSIVTGRGGFSTGTAFAALFKEAQNNNPLLTQDDFRIDFIKQTGINYIVVYPGGEIPANLSDKLQLISKDTDSGECFYKVTGFI
jgi:hypothetical protein